jgi:hypothetical protein
VVVDNVETPKIEVLTTTVVREKTATVTERVTLPVVTERVVEIPVPEVVKDVESQIPAVEEEVEAEQTSPEIVHEVEVEVEEPVETPHNPPRIDASRKSAQKALPPSTDPPSNRGPVEVHVVQVEKAAKRTM